MSQQCCDVVLCSKSSLRIVSCNITFSLITFSLSQCRFVSVARVVSQSTALTRWETMPATGMIAVARIEVHIYCISSTKRLEAYLKFRVRGGALNRVFVCVRWGEGLIKFSSERNVTSLKPTKIQLHLSFVKTVVVNLACRSRITHLTHGRSAMHVYEI